MTIEVQTLSVTKNAKRKFEPNYHLLDKWKRKDEIKIYNCSSLLNAPRSWITLLASDTVCKTSYSTALES